jgi:Carbohydrate binding module (family 35)/NPCBM-associated, NEW3 domain of alpha-galactosidase
VTYRDITVPAAGDYRLQLDTTAASPTVATSLEVSVNGAAPIEVAVPADNRDVPTSSAIPVSLGAGANTITLFSKAQVGPGVDRVAVAPLPPASYVPKTTLTVEPHGVQWLPGGQQSIKVSASLRLDATDAIDDVSLAPAVPAGWSIAGGPVTASTMRLGQTIQGSWTLTSPAGQDIGSVTAPVTAGFRILGRTKQVSTNVQAKPRPADRVFMREAEDSRNLLGSTGLTSCGPCSGGEKVRNIGGDPDASVIFPDVTVPAAGQYPLFIDFTVNGPRSYFVTVNDSAPVEVPVNGVGNNTPYTTSIPITLQAGANTIKIHNDTLAAPDLDRISIGQPGT